MRSLIYLALVWPFIAYADILVVWNPVTDDRAVGYEIHYGASSGNYTNVLVADEDGADTDRYDVTNLLLVGENYLAARTIGEVGGLTVYSDFSNEISYLNATRPNEPVNGVLEIIQL